MKKFIYSLFAVLTMGCALVSCGDDDGDAAAPAGEPSKAAAGTYQGTWTVTQDTVSVTTPGTITISDADSATAYTANFAFVAESYQIKVGTSTRTMSLSKSDVANIAFNGSATSFDFSNQVASKLGSAFAGKIVDGAISTNFTIEQTAGRRKYKFAYAFSGTKVAE